MIWIACAFALLAGTDWVALIPTVEKSIAKLEVQKASGSGICTAVLFEKGADDMMAAFTAAHCVKRDPTERMDITVSGRTAYVVDSNTILDLAIVRYRARGGEQPIVIAKQIPHKGEEVMILGYPFGVEEIAEQFGHVAQPVNKETKTTLLNAMLIFGNSGGGAVNGAGELIGINSAIVSQGPASLAAVVTVEQIIDYIDFYRARYVKKESK